MEGSIFDMEIELDLVNSVSGSSSWHECWIKDFSTSTYYRKLFNFYILDY